MSIEILMPALSPTMEEGKLAKWLVKEGDEVHSGDILAEIETDKATMEFEAVDEGRIGKLLVEEGAEGVKVNQPIATLLQNGEDASASAIPRPATPAQPKQREATQKAEAQKPAAPRQPAAPFPPRPTESPQVDPEFPADTEMVTMTVREALRDAMAEEMRRDK